jgi:hypothetical protein
MWVGLFALGTATNYGLIFDAGSSGSRIHVYTWKTGGGGPKNEFDLVSDDLLKIKPGLSAFKDSSQAAGASLAPLIEFAKQKIPAEHIASTPMFLMATAGLRMVGEGPKDAILSSVCSYLSTTGFHFRCEWAGVLDGRDEGLYGWVTVNYLLDALYHSGGTSDPVGTIDLGGGSVQIVFSMPSTSSAPPGYTEQLDFAGRKHNVYVKSHLGFGLDAARKSLLDLITKPFKVEGFQGHVSHPCLPLSVKMEHDGIVLEGSGSWLECRKLQMGLFQRPPCQHSSCSWGGAYQPPLPAAQFYGFSYLYDRTAAIGLLDGQPAQFGSAPMSRADIDARGAELCALSAADVASRFRRHQDASKSNDFCGDVAYLSALLENFGFAEHTTLTMTNKIKDVELVWTLGAMLAKSAELSSRAGYFSSFPIVIFFVLLAVRQSARDCVCTCVRHPPHARAHRLMLTVSTGWSLLYDFGAVPEVELRTRRAAASRPRLRLRTVLDRGFSMCERACACALNPPRPRTNFCIRIMLQRSMDHRLRSLELRSTRNYVQTGAGRVWISD